MATMFTKISGRLLLMKSEYVSLIKAMPMTGVLWL